MSKERNVDLVRRYFGECVGEVNGSEPDRALAVLDELMSADFVMAYNNDTDTEAARGLERHKEFLIEHGRWFQNDHWTVEAIVADESVVACRWRIQATHAERGNPIDVRAADFFGVQGGRLVELRRFLDFTALGDQIEARDGG
jgi:ketosteroid isomerase-like protein